VTTAPVSRSARTRAREEITREIKAAARRQLVELGAGDLSLRAVARELGMASSAVYRYFATRDELLTALIVDAYDAIGEAAEQAESSVDRTAFLERWLATATAVRSWAVENRREYELIFGSPVPGYAAPQVTVDPAARIPLLLVGIVRDSLVGTVTGTGASRERARHAEPPEAVQADLAALGRILELDVPPALLAEMLMAWTALIGSISFELFGHLVGSVTDYDAYFRYQMTEVGSRLGLSR
jgi:AcrR family transcriptional regulator